MVEEFRDDDSYKFCLPAGKDAGHFVFLIVKVNQCLGDDFLIFKSQGVRIVKIPGDRCLGKMGVLCNVVECHIFFAHDAGLSYLRFAMC